MKKMFFALALVVSSLGALSAQADSKTIGLRMGGGFGYGAEVSYQQPIGIANRVEVDLGLNRSGFGLSGIYQWVWDFSELADGFNWYAGVGGGIGSYNFDYLTDKNKANVTTLGVLGQIGLEYQFEIPLTISVDYRPGIYFASGLNSSFDGICLSARYRF